MNIWYFHHYATPYELSGLHRPFEMGKYFKKFGNNVTVFSSSYLHFAGENIINDNRIADIKTYDGIKTIFIKTNSYKNSKIKRIINMFDFFKGLFPISRAYAKSNGKPDIIIASGPHTLTMIAGIIIAKIYKIPCICEIRDMWPEVFFLGGLLKENGIIGRILLKIEKTIYEKADRLVFLKEGDHTYITDHKWDTEHNGKVDMAKCAYINNGVDLKLYDNRIKEYIYNDKDLDSGKFNIVYCGTIRPVNNIDMLLDVAKRLPDNVNFLIFGDGNCVDDLKKRLRNENINNVHFKGYVDNKYIPSILSKSSLNILNYSSENYNWSRGNSSNKLFEYLASGKPVVSTVQMGYDIISRYSCGYSAELCNADKIAEAIMRVINADSETYKQLCLNARKASKDFDIKKLSRGYMEVIKDTLDNYGKRKK